MVAKFNVNTGKGLSQSVRILLQSLQKVAPSDKKTPFEKKQDFKNAEFKRISILKKVA
jgi:hypothetical protein